MRIARHIDKVVVFKY